MCIRYDNSPNKGFFYSKPSFLSNAQVNAMVQASTQSSLEEADQIDTSSTATKYGVGSFVVAFRGSPTKLPYTNGLLSVPQPGPDGFCNGNYYASFLRDFEGTECVKTWATAASCAALATAQPWLSQSWWVGASGANTLYVGINPSVTISSAAAQFVTPTAGQWSTGSSRTVSGSGSFADLSGAGATCSNAVKEVTYVITHDGAGIITAVSVNIHVDTIPFARGAIAQKVSVFYVKSGTSTTQSRRRSGNAGYLPGAVVLGGTLSTSGSLTAIDENVRGIQITGPARDGSCVKENTQVAFGGNAVVTCSKTYATQAALQTDCTSVSVPTELASLTSWYVGKYGNADANNVSDWLALSPPSAPTTMPTWDAANMVCKGMITGVKLRIVYTYAGRLDNPQRLITGVSMVYVSDYVKWPGEVAVASSFAVRFRSTVQYLQQESDVSLIVPPAPPILPRLPSDVLYPFTEDLSSAHAFGVAWTAVLAVVVIFMLI
jgi:hypothetical protein